MSSLITRGLGYLAKLVTQGYGYVSGGGLSAYAETADANAVSVQATVDLGLPHLVAAQTAEANGEAEEATAEVNAGLFAEAQTATAQAEAETATAYTGLQAYASTASCNATAVWATTWPPAVTALYARAATASARATAETTQRPTVQGRTLTTFLVRIERKTTLSAVPPFSLLHTTVTTSSTHLAASERTDLLGNAPNLTELRGFVPLTTIEM
jgi:hypothetical protein